MTKDTVENVLSMLQSKDVENHVLALAILEANHNKSIDAELLLCYKFGRADKVAWKTEAPKAFAQVNAVAEVIPYTGFSYQQLFDYFTKPHVNTDLLEILLREWSKTLTALCTNSLIASIDVTLKLKTDEPF